MRPLLLRLIVSLLPALFAPRATAEIHVYPTPGDIAPSADYRVEVEQAGRRAEIFVSVSAAQWKTNASRDAAWAPFAFSGRVTVRVTKLNGAFARCRVLPSSRGIKTVVAGRTAEFTLDRPGQFDDIRIENATWRLALFTTRKSDWSRSETFGDITDATLRNVSIDGPLAHPSMIKSYEATGRFARFTFENLRIGGKLILACRKSAVTPPGVSFERNPRQHFLPPRKSAAGPIATK